MSDINNNIKSVCSFYASEWHLVTMLLPNINKEINRGTKITTILEKDLKNNMETLLEKLNLENKNKILNIGWNKNNLNEEDIKKIIENNDNIIIAGTIEYIKEIHNIIKKYINKKVTIIDCYNIDESELEIKQILKEHEKVLNTAGERDKSEYLKNTRIAN